MILKSDGERAIVALREAIAKLHGGSITPEQPPKGEHQSNGVVEEAGKTVRDMARVLKIQVESNIKRQLEMSEPIMKWLIRWAAMCVSRFHVGKDRKLHTRGKRDALARLRYCHSARECGFEDSRPTLTRKPRWTPSGPKAYGLDTTEGPTSR